MYISKDLLFIENEDAIIIYNYYTNKVVRVGKKQLIILKIILEKK